MLKKWCRIYKMNQKKTSINKKIYEQNGQKSFFGRDNLSFKCINMEKKQRFNNICKHFKLKKLFQKNRIALPIIIIKNIW